MKDGGLYEYTRSKTINGVSTKDILNNDGFKRLVNDEPSWVNPIMSGKYSNSVNSVVYFALLPYRLNDQAVRSKYLGEVEIRNKKYHKVRVDFFRRVWWRGFRRCFCLLV